jgi:HlyD family secretion protein
MTPSSRRTPRALHLPVTLVLVAMATACRDRPPSDLVRASGYVEATEVRIAPEVGGRLVDLTVDEGTRVAVGDIVARLDTADTELALTRARAERAGADAQVRLLLAGSRDEDIRQAEAQQAAAEAELAAARAEQSSAELDLRRFEELLAAESGSEKQRDDARTRVEVTGQRVSSAEQRVRAARETQLRLKAGARREEVEAARARLQATDAQIATLEKALRDAVVVSPVAGIVTEKLVEQGEIVVPRATLVVVTDLDRAWANVYVDEPVVPRVRLGQPATVFTDAGGAGIEGRVSYISPKAEFTPRNVQTAEERSKLVYRLKVSVDNRQGVLKPGMPVEAELQLAGAGPAPDAGEGR